MGDLMDSRMNLEIAKTHMSDLQRRAEAHRVIQDAAEKRRQTPVIALRLAGPDEACDLILLAGLDSAEPLRGEVLVALVDGRLVAGISLRDGRLIADPFLPTAEAAALLRTRAAHLGQDSRPSWW